MYRVWSLVGSYSVLLLTGALVALVWANLDPASYRYMVEFPLWFNGLVGSDASAWLAAHGDLHGIDYIGNTTRVLTVRFVVNGILMACFFAIAGKEVWEGLALRQGALRGRKAATPLFATAGGMIGPAAVYLGLAALLGSDLYDALARGWAVPAATDIALSYVLGRAIFGAGHPALRFLLFIAIVDDLAAMLAVSTLYPSDALAPQWLLLPLAAALAAFFLFNWLPRRMDRGRQLRPACTFLRRRLSFWPYLAAGAVSWFGVHQSGLHPALGLLPIIPAIPHADRAFGLFSEAEQYLTDILNRIEQLLKRPVAVILFLFGLTNAGVDLGAVGAATGLVLAGFLVGKPLGVIVFGWLAARPLGLGLPAGMRGADLAVAGSVAAVGFTVPLIAAAAAFGMESGHEAAKLGAILSLAAALVALVAARLLKVEKISS